MPSASALRWVAVAVFLLANTLSYLDRQLLSALGPTLSKEFGMNKADFGLLVLAFFIPYALGAPVAGWFLDRAGLTRGTVFALGLWSLVGILTGSSSGFVTLVACRAALGLAEGATIPAAGKAVGMYLLPAERALGTATGQIGISIGSSSAVLLAGWLAPSYGWRSAFVVAGALGFLWIPMWLAVSRAIPHQPLAPQPEQTLGRDPRIWRLIPATMLGMAVYSLWTQWTTLFLAEHYHLTEKQANLSFAWLPPFFFTAGGLSGGALSIYLTRTASSATAARLRAMMIAGLAQVVTAFIPHLPDPLLATAAICWSGFWAAALSVNLYALPVDFFGPQRAASGIGALTFAYGIMSAALSWGGGALIDRSGWAPVCALSAFMPILSWAILRNSDKTA